MCGVFISTVYICEPDNLSYLNSSSLGEYLVCLLCCAQNRDRVASVFHRQETISVLKKFNARRKLKAAVHATLLVTKKSSLFCKLTYVHQTRHIVVFPT